MFDLNPQDLQPLQQSPEFARTLKRFGSDSGRELGYLTLRRRICGMPLQMIPRFACPDPAALLPHLPRGPVILSPDAPCPHLARQGALRLAAPASVAMLDLQGEDAMLGAMHQKWRNRLRHGQRQGLRLQIGRYNGRSDHWLLQAETRQSKARGYRGWPPALTCCWGAEARDRTLLVEAHDAQGPVAGMLFLLHGQGATYHIGHTTAAGRAASAHNLLMWTAMRRLARKGVQQLDLGLLTQPSLDRFKLGTGARVQELGGTWLWHRPIRSVVSAMTRLARR